MAGLDGASRDSIRLVGTGQGVAAISSVPGTNWIVTLILQQPHGLWQVIDRSGRVADRVVNACTCGGLATRDAVWLSRAGHAAGESIVRIGLDRETGHLSTQQDTMVTAVFSNFSLTANGAQMVMDEGTFDFSVWDLDFAQVLNGRYPDDRRVAHALSGVSATISSERRALAGAAGRTGRRRLHRGAVLPVAVRRRRRGTDSWRWASVGGDLDGFGDGGSRDADPGRLATH